MWRKVPAKTHSAVSADKHALKKGTERKKRIALQTLGVQPTMPVGKTPTVKTVR